MKQINTILKKTMVCMILLLVIMMVGCGASGTTYKVTFKLNNGVSDMVTTVEEGSTVLAPTQPFKDDYEFIGWYYENKEFDFNTAINKDITLEARYQIDEALAERYNVSFYNGEELYKKVNVLQDRTAHNFDGPEKKGHKFLYWEYNGVEFDFNTQITSDINLIAKFEAEKIAVTFIVEGEKTVQMVDYGTPITLPKEPTKEGKAFAGWYLNGKEYDASALVTGEITLQGRFGRLPGESIKITYDFGYDCFLTKDDLRIAYYTDFYNFLQSKDFNFEKWEIVDLNSFLLFCDTWKYKDRSEMGNIGVAFQNYYLEKDVDGVPEDQSTDYFIGWCWQNNKYHDFINHLIEFFAYWRTDEGYTTETNHGNDFFYDSWAAMVDTAKFFHFTSANITDTYKWYTKEKSARVHYALDHIPGVGYVTLVKEEKFEDSVTLPTDVTRPGYDFLGWFDDDNNPITVVTDSMTVHAKWAEKTSD